jgi:hypothetical protein
MKEWCLIFAFLVYLLLGIKTLRFGLKHGLKESKCYGDIPEGLAGFLALFVGPVFIISAFVFLIIGFCI